MLARYQIVRGQRSPQNPLPKGVRIDVRKHTHHVLSPEAASVVAFLGAPSAASFRAFAKAYGATLQQRFQRDRAPFDELAARAAVEDVYIGCSCPTRKNPDVRHCHTRLALVFMQRKYPKLRVLLP